MVIIFYIQNAKVVDDRLRQFDRETLFPGRCCFMAVKAEVSKTSRYDLRGHLIARRL